MNREDYIIDITNYIGRIDSTIRLRNAIDLYDLNIIAETFFCGLLNLIYGYRLINKNNLQRHAPAIDLEDTNNRIYVQITSNNSREKIVKTLTTFSESNRINTGGKLIVLILGKVKKHYQPFNSLQGFELIILDTTDLIKEISTHDDLQYLKRICNFLQIEFENNTGDKSNVHLPIVSFGSNSVYASDRNAIILCNLFNALQDKTLWGVSGSSIDNVMKSLLEIANISCSIGKELSLDQTFIEAITFGKYLGMPPYGYTGERVLNTFCSSEFNHYTKSVKQLATLRNSSEGIGISQLLCDEIINQRASLTCKTAEGTIVKRCSKITELHQLISVGMELGCLSENSIPQNIRKVLGNNEETRYLVVIEDLVNHSVTKKEFSNSQKISVVFEELRRYAFDCVICSKEFKQKTQQRTSIIQHIFYYYSSNSDLLPEKYKQDNNIFMMDERICDYIAELSETEILKKYKEVFGIL